MSILILTEKPSVAKDLAKVFDSKTHEGFIFCQRNDLLNEEVVITWAFGHLLQIANEFPKGVQVSDLPVFPEFHYQPTESGRKQLSIIKKQISTCSKLIIATDSGREGELIARLILNHCGWNNWTNTFRFWTSEALTTDVITKNLKNLKPASNYDALYQSAIGRQHSDWIVGLNLSAVTSKTANGSYSIGRVQTPTLGLINQRIQEILSFIPKTHYSVAATFNQGGGNYSSVLLKEDSEMLSLEQVNQIIAAIQGEDKGLVKSLQAERKNTKPNLLHSLTSLQREANDKYGYSASDTLEIAQDLYEKFKAITYPRTDSNYMSESSLEMVTDLVQKFELEIDKQPNTIGKRLFDDSKLTDHHAIIPQAALSSDAGERHRNVYSLIFRRFHGSFLNDLVQNKTIIITSITNYDFKTTGTVVENIGWKKLYADEKSDKEDPLLPNIVEGSCDVVSIEEKKYVTDPPKKHTESSLLGIMEKLGLGTPATRASIIEKLIERKYIFREKKNLVTADKGSELIALVSERDFSNPELTAVWEEKLANIAKNTFSYSEFLEEIKSFTSTEVSVVSKLSFNHVSVREATPKMIQYAQNLAKQHGEKLKSTDSNTVSDLITRLADKPVNIGECACGKQITESLKSFNCSCGKIVWKISFGKTFTKAEAAKLMAGETILGKGLKKKDPAAGTYNAKLKLDAESKLKIVEFVNS